MSDRVMRRLLVAIGAITAASGATQAAAPGRVLGPLSMQDDEATRQLFGTIGMFMVVTGGTLACAPRQRVVLFWSAMQKLGAAGAVGLGVRRGVFSPRMLGVAGFDFLSGLLALAYLRRVRDG